MITVQQVMRAIHIKWRYKVDIGTGECQKNAHEIYDIPSDGTPTAAAAWEKAQYKHSMSVPPTKGSFIYYVGGNGHVVIYIKRDIFRRHWAWSPGAPKDPNHWVKVRLKDITDGWPWHTLAGWTEDIDGVRVPGLAP